MRNHMRQTKQQNSWMFILSAVLGACMGMAGCGEYDDLLPGMTEGASAGPFTGSGQGSWGSHGAGSGWTDSGSGGDVTGSFDPGDQGSGSLGTAQRRIAVLQNWDNPAPGTPITKGTVRFVGYSGENGAKAMVWLDQCSLGHYIVEIRKGSQCGATPGDNLERWDPIGFGERVRPDGSVQHAGVIGVVGCQSETFPTLLEKVTTDWRLDRRNGDPLHRTVVLRDPRSGLDIACGVVQDDPM